MLSAPGNIPPHTFAAQTGLVLRLDELRVVGMELLYLTSMRATGMFWRLRTLVLEMTYCESHQRNDEMFWDIVKNASKTLEHFFLRHGFANTTYLDDDYYQSVGVDDLPHLQTIKISESAVNYSGFKELLRIAHFLTASKQDSNLQASKCRDNSVLVPESR
ncbi:hypothetical protein GALMADRAFT_147568 [Galerina marginata CBS 339.88]|uniref:Uncharacterized protein n=1 Tax=Galerina marginata (strain CBS 339.88) TaxID=685588 RepID=A0A067S7T5_GALM3|nr:hypothetical protein GALMADRAFT_147568 [Galerina marginata CBS 339.88]